MEQAEAVGTATGTTVRNLLEPHALHNLRQVQAILRLKERFTPERLERACARVLATGDGKHATILRTLERGLDAVPLEEVPPPSQSGAYLRGAEAIAAGVR